jgi:hypothetical protein
VQSPALKAGPYGLTSTTDTSTETHPCGSAAQSTRKVGLLFRELIRYALVQMARQPKASPKPRNEQTAVKVIDPRGNELWVVKKLEEGT